MGRRVFILIVLAAFAVCAVAFAQQRKAADEARFGSVEVMRTESHVMRPARTLVIPWHVNYQGYLTDDAGNPINDTLSMRFSIWDAASVGTELWNETQNTTVEDAIFNVILGSITPIPSDVFGAGESRWLELMVEAQTLSPRTEITSVGYAYRALSADTADYALNAPADNDWTISGNVLHAAGTYGLGMQSANVFHGVNDYTHVNFGVECTTGTSGQNNSNCTVSGGYQNSASGQVATVGGGGRNTASALHATVGGGINNTAAGDRATVGGGSDNTSGYHAFVGGGGFNAADSSYGAIAGGAGNTAGRNATVAGGGQNLAIAPYSTVGGGQADTASGSHAVVSGGGKNYASGNYSFVGGGAENIADQWYSTVCGGNLNSVGAFSAVIAGGSQNSVGANYGAIVSAWGDTVSGFAGAALSGYSNVGGDEQADTAAVVVGGWDNSATGKYSSVGGGRLNTASGIYATVSGGYADTVAGDYSFASGSQVRITGGTDYTFAFGRDFTTSTPNAVIFHNTSDPVRVGIGVTAPTNYIDVAGGAYCDGTNWTNASSREYKKDISALSCEEYEEILEKLAETEVVRFRYKMQDDDDLHIGVIAEDAPEEMVDAERKGVPTGDAIGFLIAALKAQQQAMEDQQEEIEWLRKEVEALKQQ